MYLCLFLWYHCVVQNTHQKRGHAMAKCSSLLITLASVISDIPDGACEAVLNALTVYQHMRQLPGKPTDGRAVG